MVQFYITWLDGLHLKILCFIDIEPCINVYLPTYKPEVCREAIIVEFLKRLSPYILNEAHNLWGTSIIAGICTQRGEGKDNVLTRQISTCRLSTYIHVWRLAMFALFC